MTGSRFLGLAAAIALLSLTACTAEPWTLARSPSAITLRWWSDEVADAQAGAVAGAYCNRMGKAVRIGSVERDGSASIGRYRCL